MYNLHNVFYHHPHFTDEEPKMWYQEKLVSGLAEIQILLSVSSTSLPLGPLGTGGETRKLLMEAIHMLSYL